MTSVPSPAKIEDIIKDLFQNEKIKNSDNTKILVVFSRAVLTDKQKAMLTYPPDIKSLDIYLIYQTEKYDEKKRLISTNSQLVSFVKKNSDEFIYGYYFNLANQGRSDIKKLIKSEKPIKLSENVKITSEKYVEVYNRIFGKTFILGLSTAQN